MVGLRHESRRILDHGDLTGLLNDDHMQYILVNGTRAFTGHQSLGGKNLTSVGDIALDSISSAAGTSIIVNLGTDAGDDFIIDNGSAIWTFEGDTGDLVIPNGVGNIALRGFTTGNARFQGIEIENTSGYAVLNLKGEDGSDAGRIHFANDNAEAAEIKVFNDDLTISADNDVLISTSSGNFKFDATNFYPAADSVYDFGSSINYWRDAFIDRIFAGEIVSPIWRHAVATGVLGTMSTGLGTNFLTLEATSGTNTKLQLFLQGKGTSESELFVDRIASSKGTTVTVDLGTDAGDNFVVGNNDALVVEGDTDDTHVSGKLFIEDNSYWDSEVPADFLNDSTATESYIKGQIKIDAGNANTALALYADNGGATLGDDYFVIYDTSNTSSPNKLFRVQRGADSGSASVTIAGNQATFLRLGVHSIKADVNPNMFEIESGNTFDLILDAGGGGDANLQIQAAGVGINESSPDAMLEIVSDAAGEECLHLKGAVSQSASLLTMTDSSDNLFIDSGDGLTSSVFSGNVQLADIDFVWAGTSEANLFRIDTGANEVRCGDWDTNYSAFEVDGTLRFNGAATVFKDINIGAATLSGPPGLQPGIVNFLDEVGADTGIATYGLAVGEGFSGQFEMQHDYKEGSNIVFHVHWQGITAPTDTDKVKFQLTYTISKSDATLDAVTVITIETDFDTQYEFKSSAFAAITGTNFNIEDQFLFTLERIAASADEYGGEALVATVGIHYELDTVGSRAVLTK